MTKLKYGDKVKIDFDSFLTRSAQVSFGDDANYEEDVEYEYSIDDDDKGLLKYLMNNTILTIDMVDQKRYSSITKHHTIITLKELTDLDVHITFFDNELVKVD